MGARKKYVDFVSGFGEMFGLLGEEPVSMEELQKYKDIIDWDRMEWDDEEGDQENK